MNTPAVADRAQLAWFVVCTNINCEVRAKGGLEALGYTVFLPMQQKWKRRTARGTRKPERVERPLFSRYLFVGLVAGQCWYPIRRTDGVESILCADGEPQRVPDAEIARFMAAERTGLFDYTRECLFRVGDHVHVDGGPFGDFAAEVSRSDDGKRVEILHNFLGTLRRTHVDIARVTRA